MLMYYDARPCGMNGLFHTDTLAPLKGYYAIKSFSDLYDLGKAAEVTASENIYGIAATNGSESAILLTHFNDDDSTPEETVRVEIKDIPRERPLRAEFYLLDNDHDMTLVREETFNSGEFAAYLDLPLFTSYLIKFREI
jgi:hypothetical protein